MMEKTKNGERQLLAGVRVNYIAGPYCCTQVDEFDAECIKVEMPKTDDPLRNLGARVECGESLPWLSEPRNKKSVTHDLRTPEGCANHA